jgi:hypothetical protein
VLKRSGGQWAPVFYLTVAFSLCAVSVYAACASVLPVTVAGGGSASSATAESSAGIEDGGSGGGGSGSGGRGRQQVEVRRSNSLERLTHAL